MAGRRRGRTGRGWDAAPPRAPRAPEARGSGNPEPQAPGGSPETHAPGGAAARRTPAGAPTRSDPEEAARDPAELAREICLRQLAVRPRTRAELATVLRRRGVDDRVAAEVLDRYQQVGMLDDAAFARAWVSSRHHGQGLARRALGSELRRRGVAAETVGDALGELDTDTEAATARALVDRKLRTTTGRPETVVRRLVGMLARKGYPAGLAYRVVKEALAADAQTAALADQLDPDALADLAGDGDPASSDPGSGDPGNGEPGSGSG